nr:MAG TPA: hypothetical protein [Caudoviricetes sp.]DAU66838.1 MAG TPA: hypothetical protein [Caudoviricetes sp.]
MRAVKIWTQKKYIRCCLIFMLNRKISKLNMS